MGGDTTLIKKKIKFSSYIREIQEIHNGAVAKSYMTNGLLESSYMGKYLRISSYIRKPIYDFATAPL
jgi:hypothetical protein